MAARDQADNLAMLQALRNLRDDLRAEIPGFLALIALIRVQAIVDDDVEENSEFLAVCDDLEAALDTLWNTQQGFAVPTAKMLGRYAGSSDLQDFNRNLAAFQDKLVADSDEFEVRGFTKFTAWSAGGSNVGNGTAMVYNIDPAFGGDISHVETLTAECKEAPDLGSQAVFQIRGAARGDFAYLEGGSSVGNAYPMPTPGLGKQSPGLDQLSVGTGEDIESVGDEASEGNLLNDGGFEAATLVSTTDSNWVRTGSVAEINTSSPISGDQDLIFDGDDTVTQEIPNVLKPGRIYALEFWTKKVGTVSAGTTTVKLTDGTTDFITIAVTNSGASGTEKQPYGTVRLPDSAKLDLMKVTIVEASLAGGGTMQVDGVKLVEMAIVDGGRAVAFTDGTTAWARNDVFTGATTGGTDGTLQRQNNELLGRGFEADSTATDWAD